MEPLEGLDTRLLVDLLRDRKNPSKSLGQHYLVDDEVIARSVLLAGEFNHPLSEDSHVLERARSGFTDTRTTSNRLQCHSNRDRQYFDRTPGKGIWRK